MSVVRAHESLIDGQGRTTIPAAVRAHLGAAAGASLEWTVLPGRLLEVSVKVQPAKAAASVPGRNTGGLPGEPL